MKTTIYSIGRTGRTIIYETTYKDLVHKVILWPDGSSESKYMRNPFLSIFYK
jgi:hypothetical protein